MKLLSQSNKELEDFYDILKEVVKNKFNLKVVEKKMYTPINMNKKYVYINTKIDLRSKVHLLNGLLIKLTANNMLGRELSKQISTDDMNYISGKLYHWYTNDELINEIPTNKENSDKVLINLDFAYKKAKENLAI